MSVQSTRDMLATVDRRPMIEQVALLMSLLDQGEKTWGAAPPIKRAKLPFTAGILVRRTIQNGIRRHLDQGEVVYNLREYPGWFESDFSLTIEIHSWSDLRRLVTLMNTMRHWLEE